MAPARILVADDDPVMCMVLEEALTSFGHKVVVVRDGVAALAAARQDPPDLILLDQKMPGLDGLAVLAALQADPRLHAIPVVFLTGEPHRIPPHPGVAAVIGKPFGLESLRKTLHSILESRPAS
jgi:CheY-like chemotaxis protein